MNALEDRVRAQLLAERQAAAPRPDLEAQLLYALHRSEVPTRRAGVFRQVVLAAAVVGFASLVGFGFSRLQSHPAPAGHAIPTASASESTSAPPTVGADDQVYVTGCANTRTTPGLGSPVVDCLPNGTVVHVTNGPAYSDGKLWWRLQGHGWMAHDFLISPA